MNRTLGTDCRTGDCPKPGKHLHALSSALDKSQRVIPKSGRVGARTNKIHRSPMRSLGPVRRSGRSGAHVLIARLLCGRVPSSKLCPAAATLYPGRSRNKPVKSLEASRRNTPFGTDRFCLTSLSSLMLLLLTQPHLNLMLLLLMMMMTTMMTIIIIMMKALAVAPPSE